MINWIGGRMQAVQNEQRSLFERHDQLIRETLDVLTEFALWSHLQQRPLLAPFGRCGTCQEPLDVDGDCVECAGRRLEKVS